MTKIYFKYNIIVFLYAYLRQADLSLDRSRWVSISELRDYYKTQIDPEVVADYMLQHFHLNPAKLQYLYFIEGIRFPVRVNGWFLRYFRNESFLTTHELYYCCQKLRVFSEFLKSDSEIHKLEIEKLRIELVQLTYRIIEPKLSVKDRQATMRVEHFYQNEIFPCTPVRNFIKGFEFPDK